MPVRFETGNQQFEISDQLVRTVEVIALTMGGDHNMTVGVGQWGSGWYWDFARNHVNVDPKDLVEESEDVVLGIANHEGNHKYASRMEYFKDIWPKPGAAFGINAVEDPRANQAGMGVKSGSRKNIRAYIERDLSEGGGLDYKSIKKDAKEQLGYVPKFMQWGAEQIRYWYEKEFPKSINSAQDLERFIKEIPDEDVRDVFIRTLPGFEEFYNTIPHSRDEMDVHREAKKSADIFKKKMWSDYQNLVDKSYDDHSLVKMLQDMLDQDRKGQNGQVIEIPFSALPKDVQDEIRQKIKDAQKQKQQSNSGQSGEKGQSEESSDQQQEQQSGGSAKSSEGQKSQERQDGTGQESGAGQSSSQGQQSSSSQEQSSQGQDGAGSESRQAQSVSGQQSRQQGGQGSGQEGQKQSDIQESGETEAEGQSSQKIPWDQLSEKAKEEAKKAFKQLPKPKQQEYQEKAREDLEAAEDKANEKLRGEMQDPQDVETHQERREREAKEQQQQQQERQAQQITQQMQQEAQKALSEMEGNSYFEVLTMPDVASTIREWTRYFRPLFQPEEDPNVRYSSIGVRASMRRVIQREADPRIDTIFETEGEPLAKNRRFTFLVDLSGSMSGVKLMETFKTLVAIAEVFNKFGVEYEILGYPVGYGDRKIAKVYKSFDQKKLTKQARERIGEMFKDSGGGTPTLEATKEGFQRLAKQNSRHVMAYNYLLTFTDGQPNGDPSEIKEFVESKMKNRKFLLSGFGIGPGTEFVDNCYPELPRRVKQELARVLGKDLKNVGSSFKDAQEFSKAFMVIMKYMLRYPQLFFNGKK